MENYMAASKDKTQSARNWPASSGSASHSQNAVGLFYLRAATPERRLRRGSIHARPGLMSNCGPSGSLR